MTPLVGAWRLVSFVVQDKAGNLDRPFGDNRAGFIVYTDDGYVSVQFGRAGRAPLAQAGWAANRGRDVAAARDYFAYVGTYDVAGDTVYHHIALSLMPNWIGTTQSRQLFIEDDSITLSTPPLPIGGRQQVATLVWTRALP